MLGQHTRPLLPAGSPRCAVRLRGAAPPPEPIAAPGALPPCTALSCRLLLWLVTTAVQTLLIPVEAPLPPRLLLRHTFAHPCPSTSRPPGHRPRRLATAPSSAPSGASAGPTPSSSALSPRWGWSSFRRAHDAANPRAIVPTLPRLGKYSDATPVSPRESGCRERPSPKGAESPSPFGRGVGVRDVTLSFSDPGMPQSRLSSSRGARALTPLPGRQRHRRGRRPDTPAQTMTIAAPLLGVRS
jgi:hypothetical protein